MDSSGFITIFRLDLFGAALLAIQILLEKTQGAAGLLGGDVLLVPAKKKKEAKQFSRGWPILPHDDKISQ